MAIRDLRRRLTASPAELHDDELRQRWQAQATTPMGEVVSRRHAVVGGEVQGLQVRPRLGSPSLEAAVHDGTGRVTAVFTGRRSIGGLTPGREVLLKGFVQAEGHRLVMLNPAYTLLP